MRPPFRRLRQRRQSTAYIFEKLLLYRQVKRSLNNRATPPYAALVNNPSFTFKGDAVFFQFAFKGGT